MVFNTMKSFLLTVITNTNNNAIFIHALRNSQTKTNSQTAEVISLKLQNSQNENLDIEILKKDITDKKKNDLFNLYSKSHLSKLKNNSYIEFK